MFISLYFYDVVINQNIKDMKAVKFISSNVLDVFYNRVGDGLFNYTVKLLVRGRFVSVFVIGSCSLCPCGMLAKLEVKELISLSCILTKQERKLIKDFISTIKLDYK